MKNNILYYYNTFFIIAFFPSFVSGVFLPNLLCGLFIVLNLLFNLDNLKILFFKYLKPSIIFIIFYLIILISSLMSDYILHSLESSLLYFAYLIYVFSLILLFIENSLFRRLFFVCGMITCIILSIDSFYELFNGTNIIGNSSIDGRLAGLFGDRWVLGRYLIYILPILVGIFFLEINFFYKYKTFALITFSFISITIIFSGERAAFIMFFIYLFFIFSFFFNKISKLNLIIMFCLIIFLCLLPFFFNETSARLQNKVILYLTNPNLDLNQYLSMYITSWKMFIDNPILGIGPNNFRYICSEPLYNVSKWSCSSHPHNITFQLLSEIGIIGFGLVFSVFGYFLFKSIKIVISKKFSLKALGIYSLQCSIIIYLFPLMVTGNFFLSWYGFIYYLPISLFIIYSNKID